MLALILTAISLLPLLLWLAWAGLAIAFIGGILGFFAKKAEGFRFIILTIFIIATRLVIDFYLI